MAPVLRFAPSPNGRLHLGHAFSACLNYDLAQQTGGTMLLRIEDIDLGRARAHFATAIIEDLKWLGIKWSEPVIYQSQRFAIYQNALNILRDLDLLYPCWASRAEIRNHIEGQVADLSAWPRDMDGALVYPGIYRDISERKRQQLMWDSSDYAWRIKMDKLHALAEAKNGGPLLLSSFNARDPAQTKTAEVNAHNFGDIIIARKDIPTSYHLSVTVDDAAQNISHIVRGRDLYAATHIHRLLQAVLEFPEPHYLHHDLLKAPEGRRLSKTAGDGAFRRAEEAGWSAQQVRAHLPPPIGDGSYESLL